MSELKHRRGPRKNKGKRKKEDEWSSSEVVEEQDDSIEVIDLAEQAEKAHDSARARRVKREKHAAKKKQNNIISIAMIVVCAIIFGVSAYQLYSIFSEYKAGTDSYTSVSEVAITVPEGYVEEFGEEVPYEYYYVDFDSLLEINADTVGWIRFDSPESISYPLVKTDNNDTYLTTTFSGETNSAGALFLDMYNATNFMDDNTIIYGHNMKNSSMFGELDKYNDGSFYEEYPYFYIYTPDGKAMKYQVVVAEEIEATDLERYTINFGSLTEYQTYIDAILRTSFYDTGTEIDTYSKLITLSTCTGDDSTRFIVQAVKVETKDMVAPEE